MKMIAVAMTLILNGCASGAVTLPWAQGSSPNNSACTATCSARYEQCPQVFASFPERGAVECPAAHADCLKICASRQGSPTTTVVPAVSHPPEVTAVAPLVPLNGAVTKPAPPVMSSKEAKLRELRHLHDEGLISEDVYKETQRAILSEQ